MKTLILAAIRCSLMFTAVAVMPLFSVQPAQAYSVRLQEMGSNVVANGSGAINLMGLAFVLTTDMPLTGAIQASTGTIRTGQTGGALADVYTLLTGQTNFGSGGAFFPNTGTGDIVGTGLRILSRVLIVPTGYVSGTALSSSATWNNATFASLGVTPGTYVWTWGAEGAANQNFTLIIGRAGVPDGGSTVSLLGFGLLGLAALRRKLSSQERKS